jgi:hypothetical protein
MEMFLQFFTDGWRLNGEELSEALNFGLVVRAAQVGSAEKHDTVGRLSNVPMMREMGLRRQIGMD